MQEKNVILGALPDTMRSVGQQAVCPEQLPNLQGLQACNVLEGLLKLNVRDEATRSLLGKHLAQRSVLEQLSPKQLAFLAWSQGSFKHSPHFPEGRLTIRNTKCLSFHE